MANDEISKTIAELKRRQKNKYLPHSAVDELEKQIQVLEKAQKLLSIYSKTEVEMKYGYSKDDMGEVPGDNFDLVYSTTRIFPSFHVEKHFWIEDGFLNFEDYDKRFPVSEIDWKKVLDIIKKHQVENAIAFQDFFTTDIAAKDFVLKMYKIGINLSWNNGIPEGIELLIEFFESYKK